MIFGIFTLAVALSISLVAAYYSIAGLMAIFAAAPMPIIIMGATLELGKIIATVWMHKYWHRAKIQFKLYLVPAIVILMFITSMGTYGYLAKAHMDQAVPAGDVAAKVSLLDEKIKTEQDNIAANKKALQQMDAQVDQLLGRTSDDKGANRAVQVRKQQAKERKALQSEITTSQQAIAKLQEERAPIAAEVRKVEAEVGPIKYIAALIYGDNPDANLLERAVRWVIILLVAVFDPLALVLILAAEQTIDWAREDKEKENERPKAVPLTPTEPTVEEAADATLNKDVKPRYFDTPEEFFEAGRELAKEIDSKPQPYLYKPWKWIKSDVPHQVATTNTEVPLDELPGVKFDPTLVDDSLGLAYTTKSAVDDDKDNNKIIIPDLTAQADNDTRADFGSEFPQEPHKGDMFLRVDVLPNRLFKWNGFKWIDIDRASTDRYVDNPAYIEYLISKIESGEYIVDYLTVSEQDRITQYLNEKSKQ